MKWGVRNAETLARYARDAGGKAKKKVSAFAGETVQNLKAKRANRKQARRLAKEAGVSRKARKEFMRLRQETLRAHDPEKVEKGMHTLTDMELDSKLKRLETEDKVRKIAKTTRDNALDTATKKENLKKAAKEPRASVFAATVTKDIVTSTGKYAGSQAVNVIRDSILGNMGVPASKAQAKKAKKARDKGEAVAAEVLSSVTVTPSTPALPSGDSEDQNKKR